MGFNYQIFQDQSKVLYALVLAMMLVVLIFGTEDRGTRGWAFHCPPMAIISFWGAGKGAICTTYSGDPPGFGDFSGLLPVAVPINRFMVYSRYVSPP